MPPISQCWAQVTSVPSVFCVLAPNSSQSFLFLPAVSGVLPWVCALRTPENFAFPSSMSLTYCNILLGSLSVRWGYFLKKEGLPSGLSLVSPSCNPKLHNHRCSWPLFLNWDVQFLGKMMCALISWITLPSRGLQACKGLECPIVTS